MDRVVCEKSPAPGQIETFRHVWPSCTNELVIVGKRRRGAHTCGQALLTGLRRDQRWLAGGTGEATNEDRMDN
ncbi:hypothetical protein LSTR_LSTR006170 [Laodelphax striatellus]|uniref:Uncharacterized protein n=1 Tax=Laodelphax striatellus TaxID=195883 RepID=A0A482XQD4_LAOST|nr:hypothetical protein LSTR_LSTR006170 [Laodelphax striatellus]